MAFDLRIWNKHLTEVRAALVRRDKMARNLRRSGLSGQEAEIIREELAWDARATDHLKHLAAMAEDAVERERAHATVEELRQWSGLPRPKPKTVPGPSRLGISRSQPGSTSDPSRLRPTGIFPTRAVRGLPLPRRPMTRFPSRPAPQARYPVAFVIRSPPCSISTWSSSVPAQPVSCALPPPASAAARC